MALHHSQTRRHVIKSFVLAYIKTAHDSIRETMRIPGNIQWLHYDQYRFLEIIWKMDRYEIKNAYIIGKQQTRCRFLFFFFFFFFLNMLKL